MKADSRLCGGLTCLLVVLPMVILFIMFQSSTFPAATQHSLLEHRSQVTSDETSTKEFSFKDRQPYLLQPARGNDSETQSSSTFLDSVKRHIVTTSPLQGKDNLFERLNFHPDKAVLQVEDNQTTSATREKTRVRLIVLAYMRTGSTMLGNILQANPDVFYWFEPLHKLGAYHTRMAYIKRHNLTGPMNFSQKWLDVIPITFAQSQEFARSDVATGNVSAILACDLERVWWGALADGFVMNKGKRTKPLQRCLVSSTDEVHRKNCLHTARTSCRQNYSVVALKTIRFSIVRALQLMRADPKVKVLHLVRDPRAILLSRSGAGYANINQLPLEASRLCGSMANDLDLAHNVLDPDLKPRYRLVRYEDIAVSPVAAAKSIYSFIELDASEKDLQTVGHMSTSANLRKQCKDCKPKILNSQEVAQNWRLLTNSHYASLVSGPCSDVMMSLGYRVHFASEEELRNLQVPVLVKPGYSVWSPWL